ncbi:MAG: phage terminase large subunit [Methylacidiphilales bacterium]|nr:phage terminase large subunit [Candidatus Methylacidiphilales bacterium]
MDHCGLRAVDAILQPAEEGVGGVGLALPCHPVRPVLPRPHPVGNGHTRATSPRTAGPPAPEWAAIRRRPARPDQSPSLRAAGITGQITGSRADLIVPDDVEIPANSMTTLMREKSREAVKEFDSILKPGGTVRFLGTPQCDDSLYNHLKKRGYVVQIWTAQYPTREQIARYGDTLSSYIRHQLQRDPSLAGTSTEPSRFSLEDLAKRRLSLGKSTYDLQFMLDTSQSDAEKYPLKLRDLIVMALDPRQGPDVVSWGNDEKLVLPSLPNLGFDGDRLHGPANVAPTFSRYNRIVAALDSSGRGADETALAIGAELHGMVFLLHVAGWRDGYAEETLKGVAKALVRFDAHECLVESNFGDGMFLNLLRPVVEEEWKRANAKRHSLQQGGTELVEMKSGRTQKELRILSVLEPAMQQHRLVINSEVVEADFKSVKAMDAEETRDRYSLVYQMTRLTRERDCLLHDDRIEAVAIMLGSFAEVLGVSPLGMASRTAEDRLEEELEKLFEDADEVGGWPQAGKVGNLRPRAARPTVR